MAGSASVGMGLLDDDDLDGGKMTLLLPLLTGDGNPVALGPVVKRACRVVEREFCWSGWFGIGVMVPGNRKSNSN